MPRPHDGDCRCPVREVGDGLLDFTVDCDHYDQLSRILEPLREAEDRGRTAATKRAAQAASPTALFPCDGSMTCGCPKCSRERARRVRRGVPAPRQPWEARRAA